MSTVHLDLPVETNDILCNVCLAEETEFLLDVLENFESDNVNAALREYFRFQFRDKLPDFVDAEKL